MAVFLDAFDSTLGVLRTAFFGVAAVLAVVCAVDWMVRTRRVSPFGPVARFMRAKVDPLLAPVERRVVRAGGLPSSAPWWALIVVVVAGIIVLGLLDFLRGQIAFTVMAVQSGPRGIFRLLLTWLFGILQIALIVRVMLSWFPVRPGSWIARWSYTLTEWMLRPLRRIIPSLGIVDITPLVAWFLLSFLQGFLCAARVTAFSSLPLISSVMRRCAALLAFIALAQSAALTSGAFCGSTHAPTHGHHAAPTRESHHDNGSCPLMVSCTPATATVRAYTLFVPPSLADEAPALRAITLRSVTAAPEPPPPRD